MRIAVDAMGGDHAPAAIVEGAVLAARSLEITVALVGDEQCVRAELARHDFPADRVEVIHAPQVIEMHESPAAALRAKPEASMLVAAGMVATGQAQAVLSAGNSGAFMGAALTRIGTIDNVARPAIAALLPAREGRAVLIDAGANGDCPPKWLVQFAHMGDIFASRVLHIERPRIALLNIGEEPTKGNELSKAAHRALRATGLNFIGNIEGTDIVSGKTDVIVCDGFVGNIALKLGEGWANLFMTLLRQEIAQAAPTLLNDEGMARALHSLARTLDYSEYGGAPLLGVKGVVVYCHGRSTPKAVSAAVGVAVESVENRVVEGVASAFRDRTIGARAGAAGTHRQESANR